MDERKSAEYGLGCAASVINVILGILLLFSFIIVPSYSSDGTIVLVYVLAFVAIILNITGFVISGRNLTVGGVMMIATALPMLFCIVLILTAPRLTWWMTALLVLWLIAQFLSVAAAVKCFVSASAGKEELKQQYTPPDSSPPETGQPDDQNSN